MLPKRLPARLVSVPKNNTSNMQLYLNKNMSSDLEYLTLSHCWGKEMPLKTASHNLSDMLTRIPFPRLSKTFQHAVIITQRLRFEYLWIDSLCILQGNKADRANEAA
jgi:hypothetical protein